MIVSVQSRGMYISSEPTYACRQIQVDQDKFGKFNLFCSLCSETFLHHAIKLFDIFRKNLYARIEYIGCYTTFGLTNQAKLNFSIEPEANKT